MNRRELFAGLLAAMAAPAALAVKSKPARATWRLVSCPQYLVGAKDFAQAMAYEAAAAAEQGFDVPAGLSPVTQLHPQEMVLPKQYADLIRATANGTHVHVMGVDEFRAYITRHRI